MKRTLAIASSSLLVFCNEATTTASAAASARELAVRERHRKAPVAATVDAPARADFEQTYAMTANVGRIVPRERYAKVAPFCEDSRIVPAFEGLRDVVAQRALDAALAEQATLFGPPLVCFTVDHGATKLRVDFPLYAIAPYVMGAPSVALDACDASGVFQPATTGALLFP